MNTTKGIILMWFYELTFTEQRLKRNIFSLNS